MDWREKIKSMQGYGNPKGEAFIVFEDNNEIWGTNDLIEFIEQIIADDFDVEDENEKDYLCDKYGNTDIIDTY